MLWILGVFVAFCSLWISCVCHAWVWPGFTAFWFWVSLLGCFDFVFSPMFADSDLADLLGLVFLFWGFSGLAGVLVLPAVLGFWFCAPEFGLGFSVGELGTLHLPFLVGLV